jgi:serine/threonine-protein kinase
VAFAAPETFCTAQPLTAASDIYSLGVVLFLTLTGRLPFGQPEADQVAAAHLCHAPPDPRSLVPQLPGRVARVVLRMLAKDPLRRPTAEECIELLSALEIETFRERFLCVS